MDELTKISKHFNIPIENNYLCAPAWFENRRVIINFENGYSLSVIKGRFTYGSASGLVEVGLLYNDLLLYDDNLGFEDVIGHQTFEDVLEIAARIEKLPTR